MLRERARVGAGEASWEQVAAQEWRWHPASFPVALDLGHVLAADGDLEQALYWLNRAQLLAPRHPDPHLATARLLRAVGAEQQALIEYRLAMEGDWTYRARAVAAEVAATYPGEDALLRLVPAGRPGSASEIALWLREASDPRWRALARLGLDDASSSPAATVVGVFVLIDDGEQEAARGLIRDAWEREDLHRTMRLRLAIAMGRAGAPEEELRLLRSMAAGPEDAGPNFWKTLALRALRQGAPPRARVALRRLRSYGLSEYTAQSLRIEAELEASEGKNARALRLLGRSIETYGRDADTHALRASLLLEHGEREAALDAAKEAVRLDPSHRSAQRLVAELQD